MKSTLFRWGASGHVLLVIMLSASNAVGGDATDSASPVLAKIRASAMGSDWAWNQLESLTDSIGPRLSGSSQLDVAIHQISDQMRSLGARVVLQPTKIPHWIRGEEHAELTDYAGRPDRLTQNLRLTSLGGSSSTESAGLESRVIVVRDLDELKSRALEVRGAIVLFNVRFDQRLADNGLAREAYRQVAKYRNSGPSEAAALGASAALVRSLGGAEYRLPHTGWTDWKPNQTPIPAAALSAEDADLVSRLSTRGPVKMRLIIGSHQVKDADSFNVIADWPGTELPNEVVVVSGHLDSWDLGTGATDDGVGVAAAAGVIQVLQQLNLHARRSIRFIAWTDNEAGLRGAQAYFDAQVSLATAHCAAIEDDVGEGRALGIIAAISGPDVSLLRPVTTALDPIGATMVERSDGNVGDDIEPLQIAGVPGFAPLVDRRHSFDYHHTAADTLDKVNSLDLRSHVATMAVLAYFLADRPGCLARFKIRPAGS
jgi:carboxypeptidase Q